MVYLGLSPSGSLNNADYCDADADYDVDTGVDDQWSKKWSPS